MMDNLRILGRRGQCPPDSTNREECTMIMYDIWKITGCGRKSVRYYESQATFQKYFQKWSKVYSMYAFQAYRFSNKGWIEIQRS